MPVGALAWDDTATQRAGGFGGNLHHDAHLLYTLSAVQVLVTYDALDAIDTDAVVRCTRAPPAGARSAAARTR